MPDSHALALPRALSPDTLDVLTHLSTVLSEVRTTLQTSTGLDTTDDKKDGSAPAGGGLTFKDVTRASDGIKHKLQRAREQVRGLPDMQRGIDEQEAEVRELETRIERQKALLERLRGEGGGLVKEEGGDKMEM